MNHSSIDFNPDRSDVLGTNKAKASGYIGDSTLFNGTGWATEKNIHTDMYRTEYRNWKCLRETDSWLPIENFHH